MYLKLNRPNKVIAGNELGFNWYTLGALRGNCYQTTKANDHSGTQNIVEDEMANKWVDVEIVLDGIGKMAYTTVKIDGKSYGPVAGTIAEITKAESSTLGGAYEAAGADPTNGFTAFDSLTWYAPFSANTIYIDYMRAYEVDDVEENIKVELLDENKNPVTELTANTKVIPTFTVQPRFAEETSYQLISAVYVNGILDDIHMQPLTTTGEVYVDTAGWTFENTDGITVKAFIWNSLTGMMPVSTVAEASGEH